MWQIIRKLLQFIRVGLVIPDRVSDIWISSKNSYTMDRYNIFNQVHKGLRAFLYETGMQVQQTDFTREEEVVRAQESIEEALYYFNQHILHVERFIFPFVIAYHPQLIGNIKQQYQTNTVQAQKLRGAMNAYCHAVGAEEKTAAGKLILKAFTSFLVTHLDCLTREDSLLNSLLWRYYNDAELLGLEKEIVGKLPPRDLAMLSKWVIRGMNNAEIIGWLRAIEKTCISSIFSSFFNSAEKELPDCRWQRIQEALAEGTEI